MSNKIIGYIRVSTIQQNTERQLDGIKLDECFTDYASGKNVNRPQLNEMIKYVRNGDIVLIHSMDRLARNLDDLRRIIKEVTAKQAQIRFVKEGLEFTGSNSPMSNLMLSLMGAFAEFEHSIIKERQMEGIALAKARGVYKKARKKLLSDKQVIFLKERVSNNANKTQLAKDLGISRETLYQYLKAA